MTDKSKTKKTSMKKVGFVAIAAILGFSLIAVNFAVQAEAGDNAIAAKKAGMSMTNPTPAPSLVVTGHNTEVPVVANIGSFLIKSNDKGDWIVDSTIECATAVNAVTKGKKNTSESTEGAFAGAKVWFTLNDQPISIKTGDRLGDWDFNDGFAAVPTQATWNLCEQVFEMDSNFNDLITDCADAWAIYGEVEDTDDPNDIYDNLRAECPSDEEPIPNDPNELLFLCTIDPEETECTQSLEVFTKVAGTHPAMIMIHDVEGAGQIHNVTAWAALNAGTSVGSGEGDFFVTNPAEFDEESTSFGKAGVIIGKRIFVAEPIHMQTVVSEQ